MEVQKLETLPPPPGVIGSLRAGFDVVANRVALILVPLILDVFLWMGPRLSVNKLMTPFFNFMFNTFKQQVDPSYFKELASNQSMIMETLQRFNLFSLLSKLPLLPIGISSLSAQTLPVDNPLGVQKVVNVSSVLLFIGLSFLFVLIGWVGGGLYYRLVSGSILGEKGAHIGFGWVILQTLLLSFLWMIAIVTISIPLMLVIGILESISPLLASGALLIGIFFSFWLIVPLFFTPHGIFVRGQNALYSIYSSLRMIRFTLPTSGMFVLSYFILSRGLDTLWMQPSNNSWIMLVGLAGHAFIMTVLLAASFVYYRDMNNWLQIVYERLQQVGKPPSMKQA